MLSLYFPYQTYRSTWEKRSCVGYGAMNRMKIMITPLQQHYHHYHEDAVQMWNVRKLTINWLYSPRTKTYLQLFFFTFANSAITLPTSPLPPPLYFYKRNKLQTTNRIYVSCWIHRHTYLNHTNILCTTYNQTHVHRKIREKITSTRHHHQLHHYYHHQRSNFLFFSLRCAAVLMPYHYHHLQ